MDARHLAATGQTDLVRVAACNPGQQSWASPRTPAWMLPSLKSPSTPFTAPGTPFKVSGTPFKAPGTPFKAPGTPFNSSGISLSAPGTPFRAPGTPFKMPGTPRAHVQAKGPRWSTSQPPTPAFISGAIQSDGQRLTRSQPPTPAQTTGRRRLSMKSPASCLIDQTYEGTLDYGLEPCPRRRRLSSKAPGTPADLQFCPATPNPAACRRRLSVKAPGTPADLQFCPMTPDLSAWRRRTL